MWGDLIFNLLNLVIILINLSVSACIVFRTFDPGKQSSADKVR